jgi:putative flavoprotein involved in K+ transport
MNLNITGALADQRRKGPAMNSPSLLDVVVIGGGQAGLAMARQLQRRGLRLEVLEATQRTGDSWRNRWESLTLFTTGRHSALPDVPFPGDPNAFPTKDAVADYLEAYAGRYALPIRTGTRVTALTRTDGVFVAETNRGRIRARCAVVATGPFQQP